MRNQFSDSGEDLTFSFTREVRNIIIRLQDIMRF